MPLIAEPAGEGVRVRRLDELGDVVDDERVALSEWPERIRATGDERWILSDTRALYPPALAAGVRITRARDLTLAHRILRGARATAGSALASAPDDVWDAPLEPRERERPSDGAAALFDLETAPSAGRQTAVDALAEHRAQLDALAGAEDHGRLALLVAAESAGALAAAEMEHAGLPWRPDVHEAILTRELGPRPRAGARPARLESLAADIRRLLEAPALNPDSPPELVSALGHVGVAVRTARASELERVRHPAVPVILEYKRLARLVSANGWEWADTWVSGCRFRPRYVPGGVITGRWAASGGGALQLPRAVRPAVVADPGWSLVVADVAQLEPRVLSAMARDSAMAAAGRDRDLYEGVVATGAVETRARAKVAMLGALYGATTGEAGALVPRLVRAFPAALGLVEDAARAGERGEAVSSWLGRTAPAADEGWRRRQRASASAEASEAEARAARSTAAARGRFTRNYVVQSSAAEWALVWLAEVRLRLATLAGGTPSLAPEPFRLAPHLVFFLHDEIVVHTPAELAGEVREAIVEAAAAARRLLFGAAPVDFPLSVAVVEDYGSAKG